MEKSHAIELLEEALTRIKSPKPNSRGSDFQAGGAYWRLAKVLGEYVLPALGQCEGQEHANFLLHVHHPVPEGMAIVPISPNNLMLKAGGIGSHFCLCCGCDNGPGKPELVWSEMLKAASGEKGPKVRAELLNVCAAFPD